MPESLLDWKSMLVIGAKLKSAKKTMTTEEYRRRPKDVKEQDGGYLV